MRKIVLINVDFRDAYTGELHEAGDKVVMTAERVAEIKGVNPDFVSVVGVVEEANQSGSTENDEVIGEVDAADVAPTSKGKKSK